MKKFEFSKLILALVILSYFIGLIFGIVIIYKLVLLNNYTYISTSLCGLFSYIGAPVAVAIGFYSNKAKAENVEKIKINESMNQPIPLPNDLKERDTYDCN